MTECVLYLQDTKKKMLFRRELAEIKDWQYSSEGCGTTDYFEYRRRTCGVKITHSPITLANISFINLVSIFRCSSHPHNPVYERRVDPSTLRLYVNVRNVLGFYNKPPFITNY